MFFTDTVFNIMSFFQQLCPECCVICLSNKLRKQDPKCFLVTDIISTNTHSRIRTAYEEFQSSTKMISQEELHTQNYLQYIGTKK